MGRASAFTFTLLLLALCYSAYYINAPIDEVGAYNGQLAPFLMHFTNNRGAIPEARPSVNDPVIFADMRLLAALPSVDSRVSSNHAPEFLWAWGESHANEVTERRTGDVRCPKDEIRVVSNTEPYADFTATFSLPNSSKSLKASRNPIPAQFTKQELDAFEPKKGINGSAEPIMLNATIRGAILFPYTRHETRYTYDCREKCDEEGNCVIVCGCISRQETTQVVFRRELSDTKRFVLENGNVQLFLLHPILREQLHDSSFASVVALSKRMPHKVLCKMDGKNFNAAYTHFFEIETDPYGAQHIMSNENFTKGALSGDGDVGDTFTTPSEISFVSSSLHITSTQLEPSNESFSQEYSANASFSVQLGQHALSFELFDHFNDKYSANWSILSREATRISIERHGEKAAISLSDIHGAPLAAKEIGIEGSGGKSTKETDSSGIARTSVSGSLKADFKGDEKYRGSSSSLYSAAPGAPDFSAFGMLLIFACAGFLFMFLAFLGARGIRY